MKSCPVCNRVFPEDYREMCPDDGSELVAVGAQEPAVDPAPERQTRIAGFKVPTATLRAYTMLIALAVIWIFFQIATADGQTGLFGRLLHGIFLSPRNLSNLMSQTAVTGILAVGMLMVIVAGKIDLSVGSVIGLTGGIAAILVTNHGWGLAPTIVVVVLIGVLIGSVNGILVAWGNIPAFIVTLGGLLAWRGAIKGLSHGNTITIDLKLFKSMGQQYIYWPVGWAIAAVAVAGIVGLALSDRRSRRTHGLSELDNNTSLTKIVIPAAVVLGFTYVMNAYAGIPVSVLILLGVALAGAFITSNTTFGRYLYAIGGNPDAARLSGINIRQHILMVYCVLGALTALAALIHTARIGSASPDAGVLKELDAIAACVIGGASLMGGRGTIFGACIGALIMASLDNGMLLLNVQDYMQDIVKGCILVAAVGLDMVGRRNN